MTGKRASRGQQGWRWRDFKGVRLNWPPEFRLGVETGHAHLLPPGGPDLHLHVASLVAGPKLVLLLDHASPSPAEALVPGRLPTHLAPPAGWSPPASGRGPVLAEAVAHLTGLSLLGGSPLHRLSTGEAGPPSAAEPSTPHLLHLLDCSGPLLGAGHQARRMFVCLPRFGPGCLPCAAESPRPGPGAWWLGPRLGCELCLHSSGGPAFPPGREGQACPF